MINQTMYQRGAESSVIREIFTYACERKEQIGAQNVFDFSLGNPSVPAPCAIPLSALWLNLPASSFTVTRLPPACPPRARPSRHRSTAVLELRMRLRTSL